jgi:peptidoglycan-associated lipoprotein
MCRRGVGNPLGLGYFCDFLFRTTGTRVEYIVIRDIARNQPAGVTIFPSVGRTRVFQVTLRRIRMTVVSRPLYRALLVAGLVATIFTGGCKKKPIANTPPPPPPVEQPKPQPTVTLSANPSSINRGESSTLSWTSTNATQLSIAPGVGTVNAEGSIAVTLSDSTTYTITASGPGGSASATARVNVTVPPPPVQKAPEPDLNELFLREVRDAYFDFNKADIRPDAREALTKTADFLRNYPQIRVTIEGHCDERGSTEYNLALGDRRASAVKQYLVSLGISADRISTVSFGKEKPFCTEHNETCWQQNRRGHFVRAQ